jgi:GT2 family glycosyltransferase
MKLTVVIVNYNVRAYLEQCLRTVFTALEGLEGEVFVVDNQSTDGSVDMVRAKFPQVRLIANRDNVGFSRANNQAIREARGEYVLLLNPDTVVGEDVFRKVVAFLDAHPKAGGLGVKMIDGTGRFLPESKRGLPTPQVAFFKIIGLTRLFPRSRVFGRYHLGHLPENETAPIEILSGACMFLRKKTLDEVGLLDESFFMYGEDIDLSYRITLGGYDNWYFPEARIIHYKGESTKKSSVNYVFVFYNAMAIFARKHFAREGSGVFPALIKGSIYLSAAGAIVVRFVQQALLPILDLLAILLVVLRYAADGAPLLPARWPVLDEPLALAAVGLGTLAWSAALGAYDKPVRFLPPLFAITSLWAFLTIAGRLFQGTFTLGVELAPVMALVLALMLGTRLVLHALRVKGYSLRRRERERVLAVGSPEEAQQALSLLWQTHYGLGWTDMLPPGEADAARIAHIVRRRRVGELVFCAKDMPWGTIIRRMEELAHLGVDLKIAQPGRAFIIGPSSIESLQDLYILEEHALTGNAARRAKRITDAALSLAVLAGWPLLALVVRSPGGLPGLAWDVLRGKRTWVGYGSPATAALRLPALRPGIFPTCAPVGLLGPHAMLRADMAYAKDYSPWQDLRIVWRSLRR